VLSLRSEVNDRLASIPLTLSLEAMVLHRFLSATCHARSRDQAPKSEGTKPRWPRQAKRAGGEEASALEALSLCGRVLLNLCSLTCGS